VQNPLARKVLAGEIKEGGTAAVDLGKEGLTIK
jgi:hypothetical protein